MNRWLSTLLTILVVCASLAQQEQSLPSSRYVLHELPYVEIDTTSAVWDMSSLEVERSYTIQERDIQESPFRGTFPQATSFQDMGGGDHIYFRFSEQGLERFGGIAKGAVISYQDPQLVLPLPLTSTMNSKDIFSGGFEWQGVEFDRIGNIRVQAYQSGILKLPGNLCLDVILVRSEEKIIDAYEASGITRKMITKNTVYQFFLADTQDLRSILSMTEKEVDGKRTSAFGNQLSSEDLVASYPERFGFEELSASMSTTDEGVEISISDSGIEALSYSILDGSGKLVNTESLTTAPKESLNFLLPWTDYRQSHRWIVIRSGEMMQLLAYPGF